MRLTWKEANTERTTPNSSGPNQLNSTCKSPPGVIATQMDVFNGWSSAAGRQHSMNEDEEADFASFGSSETCRLNSHYDEGDQPWWTLYKGILFSSLSSVFFSLSSVIVKVLDRIHPAELAIFRFIGIFVLTLPLVVYSGENPFGPQELRHYLIIRGLAGATSLFLRFCAFRYLPIADASVIIFSVPVFVSIFARIFLKEPCGIFQFASVSITMIGLGLTTKLPLILGGEHGGGDSSIVYTQEYLNNSLSSNMNPDIQRVETLAGDVIEDHSILHHIWGVLAALGSTFFGAAVYIVIRKAKSAHHSVIMFNFGWVAIIETTIITALLDGFTAPANLKEWSLVLCLGVFSFCGQWLLTRSLQLEQAGPVSVVRAAADIVLAFVWQIWLFREVPDGWSIAGALLVTTCILMTSLRKWVLTLPEHSSVRRNLFFLNL